MFKQTCLAVNLLCIIYIYSYIGFELGEEKWWSFCMTLQRQLLGVYILVGNLPPIHLQTFWSHLPAQRSFHPGHRQQDAGSRLRCLAISPPGPPLPEGLKPNWLIKVHFGPFYICVLGLNFKKVIGWILIALMTAMGGYNALKIHYAWEC